MTPVDVTKACLDSIGEISDHIGGAIVYLDSGCTESFQYVGALPAFMEYGARAVCSLENVSPLDGVTILNPNEELADKIVIFTCCLLSDAHRYVLRCLCIHKAVRRCVVFTSISEIAHSSCPDSPLGPDAFHEYESLLLQDYDELVQKSKSGPSISEGQDAEEVTYSQEKESRFISSEKESLQSESFYAGLKGSSRRIGVNDGSQKLNILIEHFPLVLCSLSPRIFVLPSEGSIAEACLAAEGKNSLSPGLPPISTGVQPDGDEVPPGALLTANFLYHLAAKMDLKFEIFSFGDLSRSLGKIMMDMSSLYEIGRNKRSAGLLLIDRTLDLFTPCCHGDSLFDRIFSVLPRRERMASHTQTKESSLKLRYGPTVQRRSLDVLVPLDQVMGKEDAAADAYQLSECINPFLSGWGSNGPSIDVVQFHNQSESCKSGSTKNELLSGSFLSTETFRSTSFLEAILDQKTKDGSILVRKWLQDSLRRENISVNVKVRAGSATKTELQPMINALARRHSSLIRNKGIVQLSSAVLAALDEMHHSQWNESMSAEKMLIASAEDSSRSLAAQIGDLINKNVVSEPNRQTTKSSEAPISFLCFEDILLFTAIGYLLAGENFPSSGSVGPFSWQEERILKDAIVEAILDNPSIAKLKFLHSLSEDLEANYLRKSSMESVHSLQKNLDIDDFDDESWDHWGDEEAEENNEKKDEQSYNYMQLKLELRDRVDNLFKVFHKVSTLGNNILLRQSLIDENKFGNDMDIKMGLLYKLLKKVLSGHDIPGLEYHSSTVGRLFMSGFGRFGMGQNKPTLAEQNVLMIFVVGGISSKEVREVMEALSEVGRPDIELIMGGTTLLTPKDMLDLLVGNNSYL